MKDPVPPVECPPAHSKILFLTETRFARADISPTCSVATPLLRLSSFLAESEDSLDFNSISSL